VTVAPAARHATSRTRLPQELERRFEAIVFDWDGTAVPDRQAEATRLRSLVEELCELGLELAVITGTHVGNVDGQLQARPHGPGRLHLCVNRGSEVFRIDENGPQLLFRREATAEEGGALDAAAKATVAELARRGLRTEIVSQRLNRRKIDLIPEPEWADPPKARIAELLVAVEERLQAAGLMGLAEAVEMGEAAARVAGLRQPRVTSDAKHVEIGLTDKADAARWVFADLWRRGVHPEQVLVAGDEFGPLGGLPGSDSLLLVPEGARATAVTVGAEPTGAPPGVLVLRGGPAAFLRVLEEQLRRRRQGDVPAVVTDPDWCVTVDGVDPELERVNDALLTLADGQIGTSGSPVGAHPAARPQVLAAGLYAGQGSEADLLPCPVWTRVDGTLPPDAILRRRLDLRSGLLRQELLGREGGLEALLFSSLARPGVAALRAQGDPVLLRSDAPLVPVSSGAEISTVAGRTWVRERADNGGVVAAATERLRSTHLERIAAFCARGEHVPEARVALQRLDDAERAGFERLLMEHRQAWAQRWESADIRIEGDDELQRAVRFALFHLMASVADTGEAAVGARGLTGPAYRGHVFWDADVFVLPFLAATHPEAARAMLEYRLRRLPAARAAAQALGRAGVRFPWESAREGIDVTPSSVRDQAGRIVAIRTGELEEHIMADIAWAACCYIDWSGDEAFAAGPGRELLVETARYWASRIRVDRRGAAHIYGVIGPDEYHEPVDDNAFTNVMARWNLRRGAAAVVGSDHVDEDERRAWLRLADALVDGYDPVSGLYEQFAGFFRLEPLVIADVAPRRPIAADLLLGPARVAGAQVLKQADVLMMHHLLPEEAVSGSLRPNLDFYEPRTAHGSSLSPAIHAALFARERRFDEAIESLHLASRLDLDDLTRTSAGGLHVATMGGVWQTLAFGFAGIRPRGDALVVDPRLPPAWRALELRLRFHGRLLALRIDHDGVCLTGDGLALTRQNETWEVTRQ
jgi:trehalose/maltose hydrolase-like predicted phosphorylase/hydroxymethylpyrimidine pyrophosphatase-like HAD family hydrolase